MDWPLDDTGNLSPEQTALEIEKNRVAEVRKSLTILHRWKDTSHGAGFDVIIYPDAVVSVHPTTPSLSKVIVFPSTNTVKVRAIYTASDGKVRRTASTCAGRAAAATQPTPAVENLSHLRICLREAKCDSTESLDDDIELSWKESNKKYAFMSFAEFRFIILCS
jgi:hypothetical protein